MGVSIGEFIGIIIVCVVGVPILCVLVGLFLVLLTYTWPFVLLAIFVGLIWALIAK